MHYATNAVIYFNAITTIVFFLSISMIYFRSPINSTLCLALILLLSSTTLFFLHVEFLSYIFILVYVGGIALLFLFVIIMLNLKADNKKNKDFRIISGSIILFTASFIFYKNLSDIDFTVDIISILKRYVEYFFSSIFKKHKKNKMAGLPFYFFRVKKNQIARPTIYLLSASGVMVFIGAAKELNIELTCKIFHLLLTVVLVVWLIQHIRRQWSTSGVLLVLFFAITILLGFSWLWEYNLGDSLHVLFGLWTPTLLAVHANSKLRNKNIVANWPLWTSILITTIILASLENFIFISKLSFLAFNAVFLLIFFYLLWRVFKK